jgi:hypothetical protein
LLIEMLHDPDRTVQKQTIMSLGASMDARAAAALQVIANDRNDRELSTLARQMIEPR